MEILELLGFGRPNAPRSRAPQEPRDARNNFWRMLKRTIPGKVQYAIKNALPTPIQNEILFRWYAGNRDWAGCRAIAIPNNDSVGAIRIQVKGRDRYGVVDAADFDDVCEEIRQALLGLVDAVTGRPVVRRVTLSAEEFAGPYQDWLPDMTVLWDQRFAWQTIESPRFGRLRIRQQDSRSGSHTPHGFLISTGSNVEPQSDPVIRSIYDIAPTVLRQAGVTAGADIDGKPLPFAAAASGLRPAPLRLLEQREAPRLA
jgi:hypothetical protein